MGHRLLCYNQLRYRLAAKLAPGEGATPMEQLIVTLIVLWLIIVETKKK